MQRGDGLVVSVEMVDVRDNSRIWGKRYDRSLQIFSQFRMKFRASC
jgi:TolB-like protein